jgi:hypothetical protein
MSYHIQTAKTAFYQGELDTDTYTQMRINLNPVEDLAFELFGEQACQSAIQSFNPKTYRPPSEQTFLKYLDWILCSWNGPLI